MNYYERYGERELSDSQERELEERIKNEERMEKLEGCVETIKELVDGEISKEDYQGLILEIKYVVNSID